MAKDRKPLIASSTMSEKERALAAMRAINQSADEDDKKDFHRYNIEIPNEFFEEIKEFIKEQGYNLKGFFLAAAKEKIRKEKEGK